jgi:PhzF family phenazine biosynthesis protein
VAGALGLKAQQVVAAQVLDNGPVWFGLLLDDADTVLALKPDHRALKELGVKAGVAGVPRGGRHLALIGRSNREARAFGNRPCTPNDDGAKIDLEVRAFAEPIGVQEDPVTGSLNASLAEWLIADGHMPERYLAAQGQCLGRAGRCTSSATPKESLGRRRCRDLHRRQRHALRHRPCTPKSTTS